MHRDVYQQLVDWKNSTRRKPLILRGARQVGKTYLLKQLANNEYQQVAYINFEQTPKIASIFEQNLEPLLIIQQLEIFLNMKISANDTLIIFDEIQECPNALNSLKYFNEFANNFHIAAAGSLLGIQLAADKGFPVGKVNFIDLYPLSFSEFLDAIGKEKLREFITTIKKPIPLPKIFHDELINLLKYYLYIGGMPEVIVEYINSLDLIKVREVQQEILMAYTQDFAKHAESTQAIKINSIWQSIPNQLAKENKKFAYKELHQNARAREYSGALQWLLDIGMIHLVYNIATIKLPLKAYVDYNDFIIYSLDVGLLAAQSNLNPKTIITGSELFVEFKGSLTENFVAQELIATYGEQLFYWKSKGEAQVDIIFEHDNNIYPLETKSGLSTKSKSLSVYTKKFNPSIAFRTSLRNLKQDEKLINLPLYMISQLRKLDVYK